METFGMGDPSSAAAQGEQAFDPHHANGYNFTGAGPNVQTLEDAARHPYGRRHEGGGENGLTRRHTLGP